MSWHYLHVLAPVAGLAVNVLIQVAGFRLFARLGLLKSIIVGFAGGLIGMVAADVFVLLSRSAAAGEFAAALVTNLIIYSALGYCYFHFVNLGETARRVRILREIYDAQDGLTMERLLSRYNAEEIVRLRLDRLLGKGQVLLREERYFIGRRTVLLMARAIIALKLLALGKRSEFD